MADFSKDETRQNIKDFADAFSGHVRNANRLWVAIIASSAVIIFPDIDSEHGIAKLPFELGKVPTGWFYIIGFLILNMTILAFCQSYMIQYNIAKDNYDLNINTIKSNRFKNEMKLLSGYLQASGFTRVFPLVRAAESMGMKHRYFLLSYYVFLKTVALSVVVGVPILALTWSIIHVSSEMSFDRRLLYVCTPVLIGTVFSLSQVLHYEAKYMIAVIRENFLNNPS